MSSHDPILAKILIKQKESHVPSGRMMSTPAKKKPIWNKIATQRYQQLVGLRLEALLHHDGINLHPQVLVDRLYDILITGADECGPP